MERWGYVQVEQGPTDTRVLRRGVFGELLGGDRPDWTVQLTTFGEFAHSVWRPLADDITARWKDRYGAAAVDELQAALLGCLEPNDLDRPRGLVGLSQRVEPDDRVAGDERRRPSGPLPVILAQALDAFAEAVREHTDVGLGLAGNLLRAVANAPVPRRRLSAAVGLARSSTGVPWARAAVKGGLVVDDGTDLHLSAAGRAALDGYTEAVAAAERQWRRTFGSPAVTRLRHALSTVCLDGELVPAHPWFHATSESWRSKVRPADCFPHVPICQQRAFPDNADP
jgi:hypothetical protein